VAGDGRADGAAGEHADRRRHDDRPGHRAAGDEHEPGGDRAGAVEHVLPRVRLGEPVVDEDQQDRQEQHPGAGAEVAGVHRQQRDERHGQHAPAPRGPEPGGQRRLGEQCHRPGGDQVRHHPGEHPGRGGQEQDGAARGTRPRERQEPGQPRAGAGQLAPGAERRTGPAGHQRHQVCDVGRQRGDADRQDRRVGDQRGDAAGGPDDPGHRPGGQQEEKLIDLTHRSRP
jgi:hypothetical protein